ncbi:hypothetical protein Val02_77920 [Virgisporangium aliadipatigenens]|uniref:Uncharacterized protein n=1 Tax=Virgisporangium aliadipatigenens TaxID=741659 RepID=A0A8J4DUY8_9ACTN|nr:hypothetical protein [Virgisporangium aliadipatigenens]GIJ50906.1 hypothetical protein Val02_77920 [Virgisporangium aliadipatigenens]
MDIGVGFGGKQAWLAVRGVPPEKVIAALALRELGTAGWRAGIDLAHLTDDRVAVTPPLPGAGGSEWTLVAGRWLLRADAKVDVPALSATLGTEVQFFATNRVEELHRWERAVDGVPVRRFGFLGADGTVVAWWGQPDEVERAVGVPAEAPDDEDGLLVGESDVLRIAGAWSVDPSALEGKTVPGPLWIAAV